MNDSRTDSLSAHVATHDRKGREGNRKGSRVAIHASRLTRASSRPVDNATAATVHDRLGWMAAPRQIGGQ